MLLGCDVMSSPFASQQPFFTDLLNHNCLIDIRQLTQDFTHWVHHVVVIHGIITLEHLLLFLSVEGAVSHTTSWLSQIVGR